jgi:type 1 fimbriae regulatory protein FimB/type 1 fimbriae regulatory protein FimE
MAKTRLRLVTPTTKNRTVTPNRPPNSDLRTREYLTDAKVGRLMKAAAGNRWGHRDSTMALVCYRHGLRASELVDLRWDQIDFNFARWPSGGPSRARRARIRSGATNCGRSGGCSASKISPFTTAGFARMVERAGEAAGLKFKAHPHMLRHACGFELAAKGHDTRALQAYLGHKNIQHTVRYTELSPTRFKTFWRV